MFTDMSDRTKNALQLLFVLFLLGAAVTILLSLGVTRTPTDSRSVYFEVKASGGYAIITLKAGEGSITTPTTVSVPWSRTLKIKRGTEVYFSASNPSQTGELSCRILLDKKAWKQEEINAPKNGVACAGIVP